MRAAPVVAVVLATGAAAAGIVGAALLAPSPGDGDGRSQYFQGYVSPERVITLGNMTLSRGLYEIGYSATVRFESSDPEATLTCGLIDPNGIYGFFEGPSSTVVAQGAPVSIRYRDSFRLPDLTISLRCQASTAGSVTVVGTDVAMLLRER